MNAKTLFSGKKRNGLFAVMALVILAGGFYAVGALTAPAFSSPCPAGDAYVPGVGNTPAEQVATGQCVHLTVVITHQEQTVASPQLLAEGFTPSCYVNCRGITYTLDPTVLITSAGHDFEQCKIFGSAGTITCTAADSATKIGLSSSASAPVSGDFSGAGPCKTTSPSNEITSGGLADVAGTVTAGAQGSTVTTSVTNTFTALETDNNVQVACLQSELHSGGNPIIYAEGTFGPDSLVSSNTLAITWTVART